MKNFALSLIIFLLFGPFAFAGDRVLEVQSRVNSSISSILPRTDYLVVVNRTDMLDASAEGIDVANAGNAAVRRLPGLRVGVDEKGQVVLGDGGSAAYGGPVNVTVVIDSEVHEETVKMIEGLLPEIMGGAQSSDEIRIRRAVLRQPVRKDEIPPASVVVNNSVPKTEPAPGPDQTEIYKMMAAFLIGFGAILWLMGRNNGKDSSTPAQPQRPAARLSSPRDEEEKANVREDWDPKNFEDFDPQVSSLYIIKELHEKKIGKAYTLFYRSSPKAQRAVLSSMPAWLSAYVLEQFETTYGAGNVKSKDDVDPDLVLRELTVLDKALNGDESLFANNFITWLPEKALSFVSARSAMSVSTNTCVVLAFTRPDLASQFPFDESALLSNSRELKPEQTIEAYKEMKSWSARLVDQRRRPPSIVETLVRVINGLNTFEEIEGKFKSVQDKLKPNDLNQLRRLAVSLDTLKALNDEQKKEFLRYVDPNDFQYLRVLPGVEIDAWPLGQLMRPMRLNAFKLADKEQVHQGWTAMDKSKASKRLLMQLRKLVLGDKGDNADAA